MKERFERLKAEVDPDLILTHRLEDRHQDHRLVAELTWNTFRGHLVLEYEIPKYEGDLGQPNLFVPLEPERCQRKIELLRKCFPSQAGRSWFSDDTFWALLRLRGSSPAGRAASPRRSRRASSSSDAAAASSGCCCPGAGRGRAGRPDLPLFVSPPTDEPGRADAVVVFAGGDGERQEEGSAWSARAWPRCWSSPTAACPARATPGCAGTPGRPAPGCFSPDPATGRLGPSPSWPSARAGSRWS